jgi:hypothetical protein
MAICITCSWKIGTPWSASARLELLGAIDLAVGEQPVLQVRMDHAALDRPGPHDRDLDDEVVVAARQRRGSMLICARLSIWNTPTVSARQIMS